MNNGVQISAIHEDHARRAAQFEQAWRVRFARTEGYEAYDRSRRPPNDRRSPGIWLFAPDDTPSKAKTVCGRPDYLGIFSVALLGLGPVVIDPVTRISYEADA
ncbi:hypothetical protein [Pantanalinema rosaneae]|uniref:hypothetical protein n=1 Tax=Pantanalinema rosaneae TaxID=1620701 RepID=UPI003D6ED401